MIELKIKIVVAKNNVDVFTESSKTDANTYEEIISKSVSHAVGGIVAAVAGSADKVKIQTWGGDQQ